MKRDFSPVLLSFAMLLVTILTYTDVKDSPQRWRYGLSLTAMILMSIIFILGIVGYIKPRK